MTQKNLIKAMEYDCDESQSPSKIYHLSRLDKKELKSSLEKIRIKKEHRMNETFNQTASSIAKLYSHRKFDGNRLIC